jgi:hypothetical protein
MPIKLAFVDFWPDFDAKNCRVIQEITPHFPVEFSDEPDYLFFSVFGTAHLNPRYDRCIKIIWLCENIRPDFSACDYALSFDYLDDHRNLRMPFYSDMRFYLEKELNRSLVKPSDYDPTHILTSKTRFCNFIYSNWWAKERIAFFDQLSKYKQVDSGGTVKNNLGFKVGDKRSFIGSYKFTIAFENASYPGYVTEKLIDPMLADSIPIYWGSPRVAEEFNPHSFINCHEHANWQSVIERIIRLDQDDSLYLECLREPWFHGNKPTPCCLPGYMIPFFRMVFADTKPRTKRPIVRIPELPGHDPEWKLTI